jgi:uncharacterized membrane protein required for colicin V production
MSLSILDFILLIILFAFAGGGFAMGLISEVGNLVGTVVGAVVATNFFEKLAGWVGTPFGMKENLVRILCFILIFFVANRLVVAIFLLLNKIFDALAIIPFLKTINRLAGAVLGVITGGLIIGLLLVFIAKFPFANFLVKPMENSEVAQFLFKYGKTLMPLLPEYFKKATEMINMYKI